MWAAVRSRPHAMSGRLSKHARFRGFHVSPGLSVSLQNATPDLAIHGCVVKPRVCLAAIARHARCRGW